MMVRHVGCTVCDAAVPRHRLAAASLHVWMCVWTNKIIMKNVGYHLVVCVYVIIVTFQLSVLLHRCKHARCGRSQHSWSRALRLRLWWHFTGCAHVRAHVQVHLHCHGLSQSVSFERRVGTVLRRVSRRSSRRPCLSPGPSASLLWSFARLLATFGTCIPSYLDFRRLSTTRRWRSRHGACSC